MRELECLPGRGGVGNVRRWRFAGGRKRGEEERRRRRNFAGGERGGEGKRRRRCSKAGVLFKLR